MALIKCPECQSEVSDQAPTCPKCGFPFKKESSSPETVQRVVVDRVKNVELTSKKWKRMELQSALMFVGGVTLGYVGFALAMLIHPFNSMTVIAMAVGSILAIIGLIGLIRARFGAWWNHG